ncbi:helix-turn-helix domain-containing protein [Pseudoalteromonas sp. C12FD-1]|uniref:helix-turn-helix domain-containing protein n=1 Tax=Pseudoalteromonas sp. C12FD-1 TaxID=3131979 RepID=UPI00307F5B8C
MEVKIKSAQQLGKLASIVRKGQKLDQKTAGDFSGISINTVSDFENGTGSLSIGRAFDLMEALGLEVKIDVVVPQNDERAKNKLIAQINNLVAYHE